MPPFRVKPSLCHPCLLLLSLWLRHFKSTMQTESVQKPFGIGIMLLRPGCLQVSVAHSFYCYRTPFYGYATHYLAIYHKNFGRAGIFLFWDGTLLGDMPTSAFSIAGLQMCTIVHSPLSFFVFLGWYWAWSQGFALARLALYYISQALAFDDYAHGVVSIYIQVFPCT
jgi:hypothetical protein